VDSIFLRLLFFLFFDSFLVSFDTGVTSASLALVEGLDLKQVEHGLPEVADFADQQAKREQDGLEG
jgi:hypothetical protein